MSRVSSSLNPFQSSAPDTAEPGQRSISLIDHTSIQKPASVTSSTAESRQDAERNDSELQSPATPSSAPLSKLLTTSSLQGTVKQQFTKQKYARYQSDRYAHHTDDEADPQSAQPGEGTDSAQRTYLEQGRAKAVKLFRRQKDYGRATEHDAIIDILYENQRGAFLFGVPMFSSKSLLNFDPKAWQNSAFRTSAVDIRNAQVPDPSWEWTWKSWYVDMSRDVDEEGWEYSFSFQKGFAWHGNHPWFHSFVRRRRWLRRRVRKDAEHKTKNQSHELAPDYFTIHTKVLSADSQSRGFAHAASTTGEEDAVEQIDIHDIGALIRVMSKAKIDREKLVAVRKFTDQGGDDLYYLAQRMPEIMSLFIYQSSRRQLLADLMQHHSDAIERRENLANHSHTDDEDAKKSHDGAVRQAENLLGAVRAADDQVKRLEYWSDIKDMTQHGETLMSEASGNWDAKRWQGLGSHENDAFKSKQRVGDPTAEPSEQPETQSKHTKESSKSTDSSGYTTAPSIAPTGTRSLSPSGQHLPKDVDADQDLEQYVTASEAQSDDGGRKARAGKSKGKGKGKAKLSSMPMALGLDGVQEEGEDEEKEQEDMHQNRSSLEESVPPERKDDVELVAPVAVDSDEPQIMSD